MSFPFKAGIYTSLQTVDSAKASPRAPAYAGMASMDQIQLFCEAIKKGEI